MSPSEIRRGRESPASYSISRRFLKGVTVVVCYVAVDRELEGISMHQNKHLTRRKDTLLKPYTEVHQRPKSRRTPRIESTVGLQAAPDISSSRLHLSEILSKVHLGSSMMRCGLRDIRCLPEAASGC